MVDLADRKTLVLLVVW